VSLSDIFARFVAVIGGMALVMRRLTGGAPEPAWGSMPAIPAAKPQGSIPTLKMPTARGWTQGQTPVAAPGLKVNAFATGLKRVRWIHVLPNRDVLVAEAAKHARRDGSRSKADDRAEPNLADAIWRRLAPLGGVDLEPHPGAPPGPLSTNRHETLGLGRLRRKNGGWELVAGRRARRPLAFGSCQYSPAP
jgi:glucose/arabinose dehydrogenase